MSTNNDNDYLTFSTLTPRCSESPETTKRRPINFRRSSSISSSDEKDKKASSLRFRQQSTSRVLKVSTPGSRLSRESNSESGDRNVISYKPKNPKPLVESEEDMKKLQSFIDLLSNRYVDKVKLLKLSFGGICWQVRHKVWKILLGYYPTDQNKTKLVIEQKKNEYLKIKRESKHQLTPELKETRRLHHEQIEKDLRRSAPELTFVFNKHVHRLMKNVLLVWAMKHKEIGYVQSMSDLLIPLVLVFLTEHTYNPSLQNEDIDSVSNEAFEQIEVDCYWTFDSILSTIKDNYTQTLSGTTAKVRKIENGIMNIDKELYDHLLENDVDFLMFGVRYICCCLLREFQMDQCLRIWDSFVSYENRSGFNDFVIYLSVAVIHYFKKDLMQQTGAEIILFLQALPTQRITPTELNQMISAAGFYKYRVEL